MTATGVYIQNSTSKLSHESHDACELYRGSHAIRGRICRKLLTPLRQFWNLSKQFADNCLIKIEYTYGWLLTDRRLFISCSLAIFTDHRTDIKSGSSRKQHMLRVDRFLNLYFVHSFSNYIQGQTIRNDTYISRRSYHMFNKILYVLYMWLDKLENMIYQYR